MIAGSTSTTITGTAVSVAQILELLQGKSARVIIDKTSFTGLMDVKLAFSPDLAPDPEAPSLLRAIQDIGLKLEPAKAPIEVLVVDHVQRPPQN